MFPLTIPHIKKVYISDCKYLLKTAVTLHFISLSHAPPQAMMTEVPCCCVYEPDGTKSETQSTATEAAPEK